MHLNTQKRTWLSLTFLYSSTLPLSNPGIVSAFIFCSSSFTYIQYYIVEESGKMQVNLTLFYTLYILYTCTIRLGFVKEIVAKGL